MLVDDINNIKGMFAAADADSDGFITFKELDHADDLWDTEGEERRKEVQEMLGAADVDGDGRMDLDEFSYHVMKDFV